MIRDHDLFGFVFAPEKTTREDFLIWSYRNGNITDAVGTEKWLGISSKELIGANIKAIFSDEWIDSMGGKILLQRRIEETFDQMNADGRHITLTPTCVNRATNSLVHTKVFLSLINHSQQNRGKFSEHIRRSAYEVILNTTIS